MRAEIQQVLAQRLQAGDVQRLALADLGEVLVNGLATLAEVVLGPLKIGLGEAAFPLGAGVGLAQKHRADGQASNGGHQEQALWQ